MKIGVLSDCHIGAKQFKRSERFFDMINAFENAVDKMVNKDVDMVIIAGDLFDSATKTTAKARSRVISALLKLNDNGIYVYAISGNHDTPGASPLSGTDVEALDKARLLTALDSGNINIAKYDLEIRGQDYMFEGGKKDMPKIISNIKPKTSASKSIFVMHQSISGVGNIPEDMGIKLEELPQEWDLIINGHIHKHQVREVGDTKVLFPGSTERYSMNELEDKKISIIEWDENDNMNIEFLDLEGVREFVSVDVYCDDLEEDDIYKKIEKKAERYAKEDCVFRVVLKGSPTSGIDLQNSEIRDILDEYNVLYTKVQDEMQTEKKEIATEAKERMEDPEKVYVDYLTEEGYDKERAEELAGIASRVVEELTSKNIDPQELSMSLLNENVGDDNQ